MLSLSKFGLSEYAEKTRFWVFYMHGKVCWLIAYIGWLQM